MPSFIAKDPAEKGGGTMAKRRCLYHASSRDSQLPQGTEENELEQRLLKAAAWEWRTRRAGQPLGSVVCVITCSQRNHIVIPKGDPGQAFHLKTVILQMFNYFSNAKDDCKCVTCPVRSYQP